MTDAILFCLGRRASARTRAVHCCVVRRALLCRTLVGSHVVRIVAAGMSDDDGGPSQSELPFGEAVACQASATHEASRTMTTMTDTMDASMTSMVVADPAIRSAPNMPDASDPHGVCLACVKTKNRMPHTCGKRRNAPAAASATPDRSKRARRATLALMPPSEVHDSVVQDAPRTITLGAESASSGRIAASSVNDTTLTSLDDRGSADSMVTSMVPCSFSQGRLLSRTLPEISIGSAAVTLHVTAESFEYKVEIAQEVRTCTIAEVRRLTLTAAPGEDKWDCECCSSKNWSLDRAKICLACGAPSPADEMQLDRAKKAARSEMASLRPKAFGGRKLTNGAPDLFTENWAAGAYSGEKSALSVALDPSMQAPRVWDKNRQHGLMHLDSAVSMLTLGNQGLLRPELRNNARPVTVATVFLQIPRYIEIPTPSGSTQSVDTQQRGGSDVVDATANSEAICLASSATGTPEACPTTMTLMHDEAHDPPAAPSEPENMALHEVNVNVEEEGKTCPICFDEMTTSEEPWGLLRCCRNPIHMDCCASFLNHDRTTTDHARALRTGKTYHTVPIALQCPSCREPLDAKASVVSMLDACNRMQLQPAAAAASQEVEATACIGMQSLSRSVHDQRGAADDARSHGVRNGADDGDRDVLAPRAHGENAPSGRSPHVDSGAAGRGVQSHESLSLLDPSYCDTVEASSTVAEDSHALVRYDSEPVRESALNTRLHPSRALSFTKHAG